jgi:hypothetical protein
MTVAQPEMQHAGRLEAGIWGRCNFTVCAVLFVFVYLYYVDIAFVVGDTVCTDGFKS